MWTTLLARGQSASALLNGMGADRRSSHGSSGYGRNGILAKVDTR
jgi:hypothetical protein